MKKIIYLIRHVDQERKNIEGLKNKDIPLSELGKKQSIILGESDVFGKVDKVYCSEYLRAKNTAESIAKKNNLDIIVDSNFNERELGDLTLRKNIVSKHNMSYTTYQILNRSFAVENGENFNDSQERFLKSFEKIINDKENNTVIVSHGAIIKFFLLKFCEFDNINKNILFNNKEIVGEKLNSPEIIKLTFNNNEIQKIENITDRIINKQQM